MKSEQTECAHYEQCQAQANVLSNMLRIVLSILKTFYVYLLHIYRALSGICVSWQRRVDTTVYHFADRLAPLLALPLAQLSGRFPNSVISHLGN